MRLVVFLVLVSVVAHALPPSEVPLDGRKRVRDYFITIRSLNGISKAGFGRSGTITLKPKGCQIQLASAAAPGFDGRQLLGFNEQVVFESIAINPSPEGMAVRFAAPAVGAEISALALQLPPTTDLQTFADLNRHLAPDLEIVDVTKFLPNDFLRLFSSLNGIAIEPRLNEVTDFEFGALPDESGRRGQSTRRGRGEFWGFYPFVEYYVSSMRVHYTTEALIGVFERQIAIVQAFIEQHHKALIDSRISKFQILLIRSPHYHWEEIAEARWVSIPSQTERRNPLPFFQRHPSLPLVTRDRYTAMVGSVVDASGIPRMTSLESLRAILLPDAIEAPRGF